MKRVVLCILLALNLFGARLGAQDLPDAVADAYVAYGEAADAGDYEAATGYAHTAWQEGETASIDPETLSILAANYGEVASLTGRHEQAIEALERAIEILELNGISSPEEGRYLTELARSNFSSGEHRSALIASEQALEFFENQPEGLAQDLANYANWVIAAFSSFEIGRETQALRYSDLAIEYVVQNQNAQSREIALLAFVRGNAALEYNRYLDAIYYFSIAYVISENFEPQGEVGRAATRGMSRAASNFGYRIDPDEIQARVLSSGFRPAACASDDLACAEDLTSAMSNPLIEEYRPASPMFRIPPQYPVRAAELGLSGHVEVMFSVDEAGRPQDVRVVSSSNSHFDREAIRSVEAWRYWPRLVDGIPTARHGVLTTINFVMVD